MRGTQGALAARKKLTVHRKQQEKVWSVWSAPEAVPFSLRAVSQSGQ